LELEKCYFCGKQRRKAYAIAIRHGILYKTNDSGYAACSECYIKAR